MGPAHRRPRPPHHRRRTARDRGPGHDHPRRAEPPSAAAGGQPPSEVYETPSRRLRWRRVPGVPSCTAPRCKR
ncbi:conserved hypothetical protein [Streptomyces viridosporus ATCC 14672]|uniref:Uncharacterized protein n=1 Tax=Streptomyces viridosporus (strain ATCC 14672 / DSM 40746 / JCM 4963 / KCTC 9882 / NRRL B-12104 / FH 1290) TaxID=566461 RepID=D5ZU61_STRV1|nr:conserved hypothetical protein [Streptomyces viridosporus ATCC 14672]